MNAERSEICRTDPSCELRYGNSSWDSSRKSIKYTYFTSNGSVARGGEFPVEALPQMIEFAVRCCGYKLKFD